MEIGTKITLVGQTPDMQNLMAAVLGDFKNTIINATGDILKVTKQVQGLDRPVQLNALMDQTENELYYKFLEKQDGFIFVFQASQPSTFTFL